MNRSSIEKKWMNDSSNQNCSCVTFNVLQCRPALDIEKEEAADIKHTVNKL
jgi:hypothetical protein